MEGLLSYMPIARNTDPASSHMAACEITATGARGQQQRIVFRAVVENPGRTSRELAALCPLDRYQVARRLPELEEVCMVKKGPARECEVGKRLAVTWLIGERFS
jgi:predicted transcriptional regulator